MGNLSSKSTVVPVCFKSKSKSAPIEESNATHSDTETDSNGDNGEEPPQYMMKNTRPRASVSAEVYGSWNIKKEFVPPVYPKTPEQEDRITSALKHAFMFTALDDRELKQVLAAFKEFNADAGMDIMKQGDDGDALYMLDKGKLSCYITKDGDTTKVKEYNDRGECFGELALLYNTARSATITADIDSQMWSIDRETFNHVVKDAAMRKRNLHEQFLATVEILQDLTSYERAKIADALKTEKYENDVYVMKEGDVGDNFYIVEEGTCIAIKGGTVVKDYSPGDYFGELALINDGVRHADVKATSDLVLVSLNRKCFQRLLGPLSAILSERAEKYVDPV